MSVRSIKSQVYGVGKSMTQSGDAVPSRSRSGAAAASPQSYPTGGTPDTPINNMGENSCGEGGEIVEAVELVMSDSGKVKIQMLKRPAHDQVCVIDWINFTVLEDTWFRTAREHMISDDEIIMEASRYLEKIFGFGITAKRETGMNFYKQSWVLGDDMGFVCFGGQRATMLITLTGQGCTHAVDGWQQRLFDFLSNTAIRPQISRIDLAHDDLEGSYLSVDWAESQWSKGGYTQRRGGRAPSIECVGNWHRPTGAGRTLYIGTRTSGKFCRFYEKGKKEGDANSPWCRVEVEFKASDRIIPLDILISPSGYFGGAYPCFAEFAHVPTVQRLELKQKTAQVVVDAAIKTTRHQFGKYLRVFRDLFGDKEALDLVCNADKEAWPKRLKALTSNAQTGPEPVHKTMSIPVVPDFINFIKAVPSYGLNGANCYV
ncbi:MAG TPA: replication initiation factor domain-containing protein [Burkholderiaceae bacterium]|nr:replication initiation factor domain-containing protein [Burkholderiaceae bacterium]